MPITKEHVKQKSRDLLAELRILQEITLTRLMPLQMVPGSDDKLEAELELDITITNNLILELEHFVQVIDHEN